MKYSLALVLSTLLLSAGCSYIDWAGPWFGCHGEQFKKPAVRGMFGMVKAPAQCVDEAEVARYDSHHVSNLGNNIAECRKVIPQGSIVECVKERVEVQEQRIKDFQECSEESEVSKVVEACMERKGWKP